MKIVINKEKNFEEALEERINYHVSEETKEKVADHFNSDIIRHFINNKNLNEKVNAPELLEFLETFVELINDRIESKIFKLNYDTNTIEFNTENNEKLQAVDVLFKIFPEEYFIRKCLEDIIKKQNVGSAMLILNKIMGNHFLKGGWLKCE